MIVYVSPSGFAGEDARAPRSRARKRNLGEVSGESDGADGAGLVKIWRRLDQKQRAGMIF
jgi:hypothetical protein